MEVLDIRRSKQKHKKYAADVIISKLRALGSGLVPLAVRLINGRRFMNVNFGDTRFRHYRDTTPLKLYAHLDHNDWQRKQRYLARHQHNNGPAGISKTKRTCSRVLRHLNFVQMLAREFLW